MADHGGLPSDPDRYQLLVEAIDDYAIYMLDAEGHVASWNPGAQRFKGYARSEIIGQHFSRFYTPEDLATDLPSRALRQAAETGRFEQEGWRVRQNGERFWAHVVIDPIRDPSGRVIGFAKITRDLSERKAAEEALRRSEEQFRLLVQGVTDYAIYMLSPTGEVSSWNSGAKRIKGYEPGEIVGQHFSVFYTPEDRAADLPSTALRTAAEEGRFEREGWRLRKDGSRFWAHVIIDRILDDDGDVIGFAKITRDVTERMEGQRALQQAREALFQSQKLEAIGQLTGGVAHDFNNLLMAVLGSLELVRKRLPYDPAVSPLVDNAIQGAQRGASLTQRMLAFARKQDLKLEAVDLAYLVRGLLEFLRRTIGGRVEIINRLPATLPRVLTDPTQLESALLNLVVNARDAMPAGGAVTLEADVVELQDHARLLPGSYVRLRVVDEGEGMDEQTLARAAEPFFTTKGVGKGTGLGLPMVHGLMAQSGGEMSISSALGRGATVTLWFPMADKDLREASLEPEARVLPRVARRETVLVVDDDDLVLVNTTALLEDLGYEVVAASSGAEALALLDRTPEVEIVLTDLVMPQMNGAALRDEIHDRRPDLPVVITSGYPDLETQGESLTGYLPKPFTQEQVAVRLSKGLADPAAVRARSPAQATPPA